MTTNALIIRKSTLSTTVDKPQDDEAALLAMWLRKQSSAHTRKAYLTDWTRFRDRVRKPLARITLADLQGYEDSLTDLKPRSVARKLASVKSLFRFAVQLGYLRFDVARMINLPKIPSDLAERILEETDLLRMLALETDPRNQAILRTLYVCGLRVSELCGLCWRHVVARDGKAGQVTVWGKGGQSRAVLLTEKAWTTLLAIRPEEPAPDDPVFVSQRKNALTPNGVLLIVRKAAGRAGIDLKVSPHWMRHAHVSHALDRGAPIHLVSATVGHASIQTTGKYAHAKPNESSSKYIRA